MALTSCMLVGAASGQTKKPKKQTKPPVKSSDITSTRQQQQGGAGVFGTTYSISGYANDWNVSLDAAWYDVAPRSGGMQGFVTGKQKYLYTRWSFKNTAGGSQGVFQSGLPATVVFSDGNTVDVVLETYRQSDFQMLNMDFKPGQGINDAISALVIPGDVSVSKIILNVGRTYVKNEKVIRYFLVGGPADAKPDPKNVIAPLPLPWRDPSDSLGAKALENGNADLGKEYLIAQFGATVEGFTTAKTFGSNTADDDHTLLIATLKIRNPIGSPLSFGTTGMRSGMEAIITDGDGETTSVSSQWMKATREEPVEEHELKPGDSYRVRVVFTIRKIDKPLKSITLREDEFKSHGLIFDGSKVLKN